VSSFSANYQNKPTTLVRVLYRVKKYQYMVYKHFLLHGLNISIAITGAEIACRAPFRLYWISLNAAYVFEFFLQTLVMRNSPLSPPSLRLVNVDKKPLRSGDN
jgi:hypothetical protein